MLCVLLLLEAEFVPIPLLYALFCGHDVALISDVSEPYLYAHLVVRIPVLETMRFD